VNDRTIASSARPRRLFFAWATTLGTFFVVGTAVLGFAIAHLIFSFNPGLYLPQSYVTLGVFSPQTCIADLIRRGPLVVLGMLNLIVLFWFFLAQHMATFRFGIYAVHAEQRIVTDDKWGNLLLCATLFVWLMLLGLVLPSSERVCGRPMRNAFASWLLFTFWALQIVEWYVHLLMAVHRAVNPDTQERAEG
jgi:hypothetical protein